MLKVQLFAVVGSVQTSVERVYYDLAEIFDHHLIKPVGRHERFSFSKLCRDMLDQRVVGRGSEDVLEYSEHVRSVEARPVTSQNPVCFIRLA